MRQAFSFYKCRAEILTLTNRCLNWKARGLVWSSAFRRSGPRERGTPNCRFKGSRQFQIGLRLDLESPIGAPVSDSWKEFFGETSLIMPMNRTPVPGSAG